MKKLSTQIVYSFARGTLIATLAIFLPMVVYGQDIPLEVKETFYGRFQQTMNGVSLYPDFSSGSFNINLTSCTGGAPAIEHAYFIWQQRWISNIGSTASPDFAVDTDAGTIHLQDGQVQHGDWSMAFAEKATPQKQGREVLYEDIQPGVDLRWYDKGKKLAGYDMILEPDLYPATVRLDLNGEEEAAFIKNDQLVLPQSDSTALVHSKPITYQEIEGDKKMIESRSQLENGLLSFATEFKNPDTNYYVDGSLEQTDILIHYLQKETRQDVFQLFSHGRPGELFIEGEWKNAEEIVHWYSNQSITANHLNIYGCNFAQGETGRAAVNYLEAALGVSVAASDDVTGIDGDWDLEVGQAVAYLSVLDYKYSLQTCDCTEYLYLNELTGARVHKYAVAANGTLTEVGNPWVTGSAPFNAPHGLGVDINGFIYIAENYSPGNIRRLTCDGDLLPTSEFAIPIEGASNIQAIGNDLIVQETDVLGLSIYNTCTQSLVRTICFDGPQLASDWGLYIDENDTIYVATGASNDAIYKFTLEESELGCITPLVEGTPGNPLFNPAATNSNNFEAMGITADGDGNIYVIGGTNYGTNGIMYKFDANGNALGNTGVLPNNPVGVMWVETCDCIYVSGNTTTDDCIAIYNTDLSYRGTGVGPGTSTLQLGKGLGKTVECCPTTPGPLVYNETVCSSGQGEQIFLQDILDCGNGRICEGQWAEIANTSGGAIVFNDCDFSITVNGSGCATYVLEKTTPATGNQQCGVFSIQLEVCTGVPDAGTISPAQGTCTGTTPNDDATIALSAVMNGDEAGISAGATYTGPAYGDAANIDISSGSGTFMNLMHNTQYTVRVFNGANDCFVDETITTADIDCSGTFDLALTKVINTTATPGPYVPGDDVTFTIEVFNQGTLDAFNVQINDYIPTGLTLNDANWTASGATATLNTMIASIPAGMSETVDITFTIDAGFMGTSITNDAEIAAADDDMDGTNTPPTDADSTPDNNANPNDANDNDTAATDGSDDQDPAEVPVVQTFDLALTKIESTMGPYLPGDDVTFTISVFNQGTLDAAAINITDYIPSDMSYTATGSTASGALTTANSATATLTNNGDGTFVIDALGAGDAVSFDIALTIDATFTGTMITNHAEIVAASNALSQDDQDDDLDDPNNQGVANAGMETDDDIDDEAAGTPGTVDNADDQDDFDFDEITVRQEVAVGNIVFFDEDGDGIFDVGEDMGIADVTVELYASTADPGNDTPLATTTTDANGYYIFDELAPGDYIVYIPGAELADGGDLDNLLTSLAEGADDANDDDADENGQNTLVNGGVASTVISLGLNAEPTGEAGQQTGAYMGDLDDDNVNLTVDFGFRRNCPTGNCFGVRVEISDR